MRPERRLEAIWYGGHFIGPVLVPLGVLFCFGAWLRRWAYATGLATVHRLRVPVIIVGNITVGGTGKTPLAIWIACFLKSEGYRPGLVCRGYGGRASQWPQQVRPDSDPLMTGDESVLLARRTGCPVAAGPNRVAAAEGLLAYADCDIIVSDDGLQHFALGRDVEIVVVDGERRFGNGRCLPAGPLRERTPRLRNVDMIVTNGAAQRGEFGLQLAAGDPRNVADETQSCALADFKGKPVHALCGIGHPERFFKQLRRAGLEVLTHPFPDHYVFHKADIDFGDEYPVIMTEKDAVKCRWLAGERHWYLPVEADLKAVFGHRLLALLGKKKDGQETARDPGVSRV